MPLASSSATIARVLRHRLGKSLRKIYLAEGKTPPAPLAFLVHFPRVSLVLHGCDEMDIGQASSKRTIRARAGDVVLIPSNCWNRPTWRYRARVLHFLLGKTQVGVSLVSHKGGSQIPSQAFKTTLSRLGTEPLDDIIKALAGPRPAADRASLDRLLTQSFFHCCLQALENPSASSRGKAREKYERICLYVQESFQQPITRDSVAALFRLSSNHLSRLFRREGSMRFIDYLTWVRIDRAKFLLRQYDLSVDEIAVRCGFHETAYFCRVFRKKTKSTPSTYRLNLRKQRKPASLSFRTKKIRRAAASTGSMPNAARPPAQAW
jgi:AraC-like DNA-binding protein